MFKHTHVIKTHEPIYSKTGVYSDTHYCSYFCSVKKIVGRTTFYTSTLNFSHEKSSKIATVHVFELYAPRVC